MPKAKKKEDKEVDKKLTLDENELKLFLENNLTMLQAKDVFKISQNNTYGPFFRVDVWGKKTNNKNSIVTSFFIIDSFFIEQTESGEIINRTITKD